MRAAAEHLTPGTPRPPKGVRAVCKRARLTLPRKVPGAKPPQ